MKGFLKKKGGFFGTYNRYYVVVEGKNVNIYSSQTDTSPTFVIPLVGASVVEADHLIGKKFSFAIFPSASVAQKNAYPGAPVHLLAENAKERDEWIKALREPQQSSQDTSEQGLIQTVEAMIDSVVVSDGHGMIMAFNHAAEIMFGWSAKDILGKNVFVLMPEMYATHHAHYMRNYEQTSKRSLIGKPRRLTALRRNGTFLPIELSLGEMPTNAQGARFIAVFREIAQDDSSSVSSLSRNSSMDRLPISPTSANPWSSVDAQRQNVARLLNTHEAQKRALMGAMEQQEHDDLSTSHDISDSDDAVSDGSSDDLTSDLLDMTEEDHKNQDVLLSNHFQCMDRLTRVVKNLDQLVSTLVDDAKTTTSFSFASVLDSKISLIEELEKQFSESKTKIRELESHNTMLSTWLKIRTDNVFQLQRKVTTLSKRLGTTSFGRLQSSIQQLPPSLLLPTTTTSTTTGTAASASPPPSKPPLRPPSPLTQPLQQQQQQRSVEDRTKPQKQSVATVAAATATGGGNSGGSSVGSCPVAHGGVELQPTPPPSLPPSQKKSSPTSPTPPTSTHPANRPSPAAPGPPIAAATTSATTAPSLVPPPVPPPPRPASPAGPSPRRQVLVSFAWDSEIRQLHEQVVQIQQSRFVQNNSDATAALGCLQLPTDTTTSDAFLQFDLGVLQELNGFLEARSKVAPDPSVEGQHKKEIDDLKSRVTELAQKVKSAEQTTTLPSKPQSLHVPTTTATVTAMQTQVSPQQQERRRSSVHFQTPEHHQELLAQVAEQDKAFRRARAVANFKVIVHKAHLEHIREQRTENQLGACDRSCEDFLRRMEERRLAALAKWERRRLQIVAARDEMLSKVLVEAQKWGSESPLTKRRMSTQQRTALPVSKIDQSSTSLPKIKDAFEFSVEVSSPTMMFAPHSDGFPQLIVRPTTGRQAGPSRQGAPQPAYPSGSQTDRPSHRAATTTGPTPQQPNFLHRQSISVQYAPERRTSMYVEKQKL